ncbi:hypothetical protein Gotur_010923 [Gossypium turneri]
MAKASGFFTPSLRTKIQPSIGVSRSGFCLSEGIFKRVVCSSGIESAGTHVSSSQSRIPKLNSCCTLARITFDEQRLGSHLRKWHCVSLITAIKKPFRSLGIKIKENVVCKPLLTLKFLEFSCQTSMPVIGVYCCKLVGCGSAVPSLSVSNDDLAKIVDTSDEWISVRTGIRNRRVISGNSSIVDSFASISCLPLM